MFHVAFYCRLKSFCSSVAFTLSKVNVTNLLGIQVFLVFALKFAVKTHFNIPASNQKKFSKLKHYFVQEIEAIL